MDLLHHLGKRKRRIVTFTIPFEIFTYHIKTLQEESAKKSNIPWIWRIIYGHKLPYMKKTKITLYEEDKKEEASMRCSLLHGSWDQILRRCPSVRPSVCLSHLFDYVPIIVSSWNFQELLPMTKVRSMQKVKVRGQRSRSQRSQPNLTVSGLWLQFEFTYDDKMMHIAWCCLEEVPYCFSRSSVKFQGHTALKIFEFDPDWAFPDCNSSLNSPMANKWCTKLEIALKRCPIDFQGHPSNFRITRL